MYIDPSSGGVVFQALVAVFAVISGALFFFSSRIRAGIARLRRRFRKDDDEQDQA